MMKAYASGGKGDAAYTKKAIQQAVRSGMSEGEAKKLVRANANRKTRKSNRQNYVSKTGARPEYFTAGPN